MEDTPPSSTTPALRGFDIEADRRSVARRRGGTYEGVVQEQDDFSWEPRRWSIRPARLLYAYAPNSNEPSVIYDIDAFTRTELMNEVAWEGAVRARFRDTGELLRFKQGLADADCAQLRRRADASEAKAAAYEALAAQHRRRFVEAEAARDAAAQNVRLETERADELEAALHAARGDDAPRSSTRARPREASKAILRKRAGVIDDARAAAAAHDACLVAARADVRAAHEERDAARRRCAAAEESRRELEARLADFSVNGRGGEELQRCKKERKVLIRAVRELRRRVRKLREADRKADAVSAYWGSGQEPAVASTQRADDDWIEVYLKELHVSGSEDEAPPSPPPSLPRDGDAFDAAAAAARDTAAAAARFVRARLPAPSPPTREPRVEAI